MCVQTYLSDSDITAFDNQFPCYHEYEDTIENATGHQIVRWLNLNGIDQDEIEYRFAVLGENVRDIAQELIDAGHEFTIN